MTIHDIWSFLSCYFNLAYLLFHLILSRLWRWFPAVCRTRVYRRRRGDWTWKMKKNRRNRRNSLILLKIFEKKLKNYLRACVDWQHSHAVYRDLLEPQDHPHQEQTIYSLKSPLKIKLLLINPFTVMLCIINFMMAFLYFLDSKANLALHINLS